MFTPRLRHLLSHTHQTFPKEGVYIKDKLTATEKVPAKYLLHIIGVKPEGEGERGGDSGL